MGILSTVLITLGYLPQTIKTIRTRSTGDIAVGSFIIISCASVSFVIYGLLIGAYYVSIGNGLTFIMSSIIFGIKVANDIRAKRNAGRA